MSVKEFGNAAAMREALLAVKKSIDGIGASSLDCDPVILMSALTQICARISSRIDAALAAPQKNCDRFNAAADAIDAFQDKSANSLVYIEAWNEFICWLFAPATERKGESDGK